MKINLSKSNIIVLIISGLTIPLLIVGIFYLTKSEKPNSSLLKIIPVDACIILQTNDLNSLNQKIKPIDNVLKLFSCSKTFENLCNNIFFIDSLLNTNLNFKEFAKNAEAVVSIHQTGKETSEYIFSISTKKTITENDVINIINKTTKNIAIISKTNYENSQIFEVKTLDKYIFSFCLHKNIIVFSYSNEMLKKMIRQISSSSTLFNDKNFSCVYKNADENAPLNLFLNYKLLSETKDLFFDFKNQQNTNLFSNFANWSAFDFSFDTNSIRLNGYTSINQSFLQIFQNQTPQSNDVLKYFPEKTSAFITLGFNSGIEFKNNYQNYLSKNKLLADYKRNIENSFKQCTTEKMKYQFYDYIDNNIAIIFEDVNKTGQNQEEYVFVETNSVEKMNAFLDTIQKSNFTSSKQPKEYNYEKNGELYKIKSICMNDIISSTFGSYFSKFKCSNYTFFDNYIVFANSQQALINIINSYEDKRTMLNKTSDSKLFSSIPDDSNIMFYANPSSTILFNEILNNETNLDFIADAQKLKNISGSVFQFISGKEMYYSIIQINFEPNNQNLNETIWECSIDTITNSKPQIVINHNTNEKEIIVQDQNNNLYLIDKKGKILWKKSLNKKILSKIFQVDYYKNNKLQFLFNTENELIVIDRNGYYIEDFPIKLNSKATNGISLFDYDQNKEYRILLATKNKKINALDIFGKQIDGWNFLTTNTEVISEIQYFKYQDKDYIIFKDKSKIYILNRKGETRIKPIADFNVSKNSKFYFEPKTKTSEARFVVTNSTGDVHFIYLNGIIKKMNLRESSESHFFIYQDINNDKLKEFIYCDKNELEVFSRDKSNLFSYSFDEDILTEPMIFTFSDKNTKIGINSSKEYKLFLFDYNGDLVSGFPLRGNTQFSIGSFDNSTNYELITGCNENFILKYSIKK